MLSYIIIGARALRGQRRVTMSRSSSSVASAWAWGGRRGERGALHDDPIILTIVARGKPILTP
eukprot:scaffold244436_cov30-Tisochrysis_lutea.AAC.1